MFGGPEGVIVLVLILVLFGGSQLPKLAKNLGEAQRELRKGMESSDSPAAESTPAKPADVAVPPATPATELPEPPVAHP